VRRISQALKELVDEVNRRGTTVRGRQLTSTQVSDLQDRWVISADQWTHPGRPIGGSSTRYPETTIETIEAVAKGLNEKLDTNRAILVAFAEGAKVLDTGLRIAYRAYLQGLQKTVQLVSNGQKRLRTPSGVLLAPLDPLSRSALLDVANGIKPLPDALDALFSVLGLPEDLRTAPREASTIDYPSMEEFLTSLNVARLLQKIRNTDATELAWAAQSILTFVRYSLLLYRITSMTGSSGLPVASDDPEVVESAQHVFAALVAYGRFLDRLEGLSNRRIDVEVAALSAPAVLVGFDLLPPGARSTYESLTDQVTQNLPRLRAIESLIREMPVERRHLLSWESQARLTLLPADELEELRGIAGAWRERHPNMAPLLTGETPPGHGTDPPALPHAPCR
jgi:hypothetical protein